MSINELKQEVIRQFVIKIETTRDERVLRMIIDFLNGIGTETKDEMNLSRYYDSIKAKYSAVLKKL